MRAAVASAGLAFVAFASNQHATQALLPLFGATLVVTTTGYFAGRIVRPGALALVGAAMAAIATWLLPQRPDVGSLLVLSAFFGIGAGFASSSSESLWPSTDRARTIAAVVGGGAIVAVTAMKSSQSNNALLWYAAMVVVAAGCLTRAGAFTRASPTTTTPEASDTQPRRRVRERAVGAFLVVVVAGTTMYFGASTVSASWFGGGVTHGSRSSRLVALTFDDGPNAATTLPLMQMLDANHVKATFFIVGKALDAYPTIVQALVDDGQLVGNHSYHHDQWRWLDPSYPELDRTQDAFARHKLPCPAWYRPPHGQRTPFIARIVHQHHMRMVLWDTAAGDWATNDAQLIARRVLAHVRGGSIVLLHDGLDGNPQANRKVILRAMPLILAGLKAKGLQPVRLDRLLGGPAYTKC
jgi:peptidoglycan/xylan/chitin deacetylase (PgdA/CDA1 family)